MAELTLNVNQWLCGNHSEDRESNIGIQHLGNNKGVLLTENAPNSKEHSMCCIGQFLSQAGVSDDIMVGYGQPGDFNGGNVNLETVNQEITDIFFTKSGGIVDDTGLANDLMVINDSRETTVFEKIQKIRSALERQGHALKIEDPKGELEMLKHKYLEEKLSV